jgi:hypothetical protein
VTSSRRRSSLHSNHPEFSGERALADGGKIPNPRTVDSIRGAGEEWVDMKDAIVATVSLLPTQGKALRVQVTMDERLLARIDAVTKNRSAFLSQAALRVLEKG